jgi:hypothetical protein
LVAKADFTAIDRPVENRVHESRDRYRANEVLGYIRKRLLVGFDRTVIAGLRLAEPELTGTIAPLLDSAKPIPAIATGPPIGKMSL